jgi:hypothetical protein
MLTDFRWRRLPNNHPGILGKYDQATNSTVVKMVALVLREIFPELLESRSDAGKNQEYGLDTEELGSAGNFLTVKSSTPKQSVILLFNRLYYESMLIRR